VFIDSFYYTVKVATGTIARRRANANMPCVHRPIRSSALFIALLLGALQPVIAQIDAGVVGSDSDAIVLTNITSNESPEPGSGPVGPLATNSAIALTVNNVDEQHEPDLSQISNVTQIVDLHALIMRVARDCRVGPELIAAVAAAESRFNPLARSPKGALGLMQLMPDTARRFGVTNVWSVEDNLRGGAAYLRWLLDFFTGDTRLAVAAYNAGENAVIKAGRRVPAFDETRRYVPRVLAWRDLYAREFDQVAASRASPTGPARQRVASGAAQGPTRSCVPTPADARITGR
jgi:hypothetical protein